MSAASRNEPTSSKLLGIVGIDGRAVSEHSEVPLLGRICRDPRVPEQRLRISAVLREGRNADRAIDGERNARDDDRRLDGDAYFLRQRHRLLVVVVLDDDGELVTSESRKELVDADYLPQYPCDLDEELVAALMASACC